MSVTRFQFTREEIASRDYARFLGFVSPDTGRGDDFLERPDLRRLHRAVDFEFETSTSPDPIYAIPEVRGFVDQLWTLFPYSAFVGSLANPTLKFMVLCRIPSQNVVSGEKTGLSHAFVMPRKLWFEEVIHDLKRYQIASERAGFSEAEYQRGLSELVGYFGVRAGDRPE